MKNDFYTYIGDIFKWYYLSNKDVPWKSNLKLFGLQRCSSSLVQFTSYYLLKKLNINCYLALMRNLILRQIRLSVGQSTESVIFVFLQSFSDSFISDLIQHTGIFSCSPYRLPQFGTINVQILLLLLLNMISFPKTGRTFFLLFASSRSGGKQNQQICLFVWHSKHHIIPPALWRDLRNVSYCISLFQFEK